jgi:M3 family oligoendopeptidase
MKFPDMPYVRPDFDEVSKLMTEFIERFKNAKTADEAFEIYREFEEASTERISMFSIANIRHTLDTNDKFYDEEKNYMNEVGPKLQAISQQWTKLLLDSPFRADMEAKWGKLMFSNAEMNLRTFSPEMVSDLQEENKLRSEYSKLIASAQIEFDGKTLTLAQLAPYREDKDAAIRKAATDAHAAWFLAHAEEFDSLYDKLVALRTKMGKTLGHDGYLPLGYDRMMRNSYDKDMVAKFREGVIKYIVPVAARLKDAQKERIGVTTLKTYDDSFEYPEGNAKPIGTPDEIFAHGKKMYQELSPETGEFMDFMLENDLFDVLTRPGKQAGGYCSHIPKYKSPFIFANFNGTSGDIDVLTHEAGHAFAGYVNRDIYPRSLANYSMETAEVHSMAMEFFTWPWMEGFFGDQTKKYYYSHLASALIFIPYGTMVDEFQHHVYEKPEMTPAERNKLWLELEAKYRPWLDLTDTPFHGEGRRWQGQGHIYSMPFYYIDYCLAQIMALSFWTQTQESHTDAWAKYRRFVGFGGTKTFVDLVVDAGLPSPFVPENLKPVADAAMKWLDENKL